MASKKKVLHPFQPCPHGVLLGIRKWMDEPINTLLRQRRQLGRHDLDWPSGPSV